MSRFSRRTLLQSSAVLAAPLFPAPAGSGIKRDLLTAGWPAERRSKVLVSRERFRPFPIASERGPWEALPADARTALVESGEKQLFESLSPTAPLRTGLLVLLSISTAWAGVRWRRAELMRLSYPRSALAGIKVAVEDFHQSRSLLLFVSLIFCGGGLVLLRRLLRK